MSSLIYSTTIPDAPSVTLTSVKRNTLLIQQSGQRIMIQWFQWFSHTTQSSLSFLFLIYRNTLSLTVATVYRHGVGSVTWRQTWRWQKSVFLIELEPHFTHEGKKWAPLRKSRWQQREWWCTHADKRGTSHRVDLFEFKPNDDAQGNDLQAMFWHCCSTAR